MKPLSLTILLAAAVSSLPAQNTPPAPVPRGTGAVPGSTPPAPGAAVAAGEAAAPVDPASPEELKQYSLDRYDKIVEKSPFNFKIVRQEGPPAISFAADLALAGFTIDAGKGITYASVVDKKKNTRFVINDQAPNKDGIQLVKLNRGDTLLMSTILARKGSEEREIKAEKQIVERKAVVATIAQVGRQQRKGDSRFPACRAVRRAGVPAAANEVRQQINNAIQQPPTPGTNAPPAPTPPQPAGNPQINTGSTATPPPTAAEQAMQRQNPGAAGGQRGDQPQPNKRRVILPPPVTN